VSIHLQAALDELTARRDALNGVIATLQEVLGTVSQTPTAPSTPPSRRVTAAKPRRQSPPARVTKPTQVGPRAELAAARDQAILSALKRNDGLGTSKLLQAAMPKEPGLNAEQKDDAYRNTMTRLKNKGLIGRTGDTWSLVGIGSERT
jgi:hypothetical protein